MIWPYKGGGGGRLRRRRPSVSTSTRSIMRIRTRIVAAGPEWCPWARMEWRAANLVANSIARAAAAHGFADLPFWIAGPSCEQWQQLARAAQI